jgi:RNA polymerase sigma-70 factor (ECF subfamily)
LQSSDGVAIAGLFPMADHAESDCSGLFDELRSPLRRYVLFLGLSPEDADDVVQETFFRLHKHFQAQGERSNLHAWIFEVARNLVRDHRKSVWRRVLRSLAPSASEFVENRERNPEEDLLSREKLTRVRGAINRLSPQQRECLQLRVAGLRYREIADIMGIGISAVGELVQRATKRLGEDVR